MWADPDRLDQIFVNLIENALRHGAGTVTVSVMRTAAAGTGRRHAAATPDVCGVADEGDGIRDRAPDLASSAASGTARRRGGTGLGLYIVRGLVEAHGGTHQRRSRAAGGADFRLTLPSGAPEHVL